MNTQKGTGKRGRPKRKTEEEIPSDTDFVKKKSSKKAQKTAVASKKASENEKQKKKRAKRNKITFSDSSQVESSESEEVKQQPVVKMTSIPLEVFKPDKFFAEILNKANKEPQFLINLRNLLSGCSRLLRDKKMYLEKKWKLLRNSNCTQDQYLSRQAEVILLEDS